MAKGFWIKLKKPIMVLAPMADVTDAAFRQIIAKYGKPDVMFTEFVSTDGLCSRGQKNLLIDLKYSPKERPIVAQIFGDKSENFFKTAKLLKKLGFDGIDINMGCPQKNIVKQGSCSALIKNPKLAQECILATMKGAPDLPVSVKTRIGYYQDELDTWLPALLETKPAAITIHARTAKEMSLMPAHWDKIKKAIEIRNNLKSETLILGNGDVKTIQEAKQKVEETGCDGVMIGRGIFGNPWLFNKKRKSEIVSAEGGSTSGGKKEKKIEVMLEHAQLYHKIFGKKKNFEIMKKHFKAYVSGFDGAKELRTRLMLCHNLKEVKQVIKEYKKTAG